MKFRYFSPLLLATSLVCNAAHAEFKAYALKQASDQIKVDGKLDEDVWQKAQAHEVFYQTVPFDKVLAKVKTEVRIAFDAQHLYLAVKAYEPEPDALRSSFARRDKVGTDQDFIGLFIDPSGAHKAAQSFYVNAKGAINDGYYSDANGDDYAPDFDYEVKTGRFDAGWTAEFKIPFASLAFDASQITNWNLLVMRNMTRDTRYRMYSGMVTRATSCNLCSSEPILGLQDLPSGLSWNATPQWVTRQTRDQFGNNAAQSKLSHRPSLDFKIKPDSSTSIDGTINPDFSQVELDAPQLSGNTRFSLSLTEKRPFFLEGADILRSPLNAIYTRTISNPKWGLRYTRRDAQSDITVLTNADQTGNLVLIPGAYGTRVISTNTDSQASIARSNWRQGSLIVGGIISDRSYAQGNGSNRVYGADANWQKNDNERWRTQVLLSDTDALLNTNGQLRRGAAERGYAAYADWSLADDKWALNLSTTHISDKFRADNGFFAQSAFRQYAGDYSYKLGRTGLWHEFNLTAKFDRKYDLQGDLISSDIAPGIWMMGPRDSTFSLNFAPANQTRLEKNGALYQARLLRASYSIAPSASITRINGDVSFGEIIDSVAGRVGRGGSWSLNAKLRPFDRLELEPNLALSWINGKQGEVAGERLYTETALQLNSILHLSTVDTLRLMTQVANTRRDQRWYTQNINPRSQRQIASLVYTHNPGLGKAIYLGWTQSDDNAWNAATRRQQRELFAKLSWRI